MQIITGKTAGFCFGVQNAIENTKKEIENSNKVYCLGELVHNKEVTEELATKGVEFIEDIKEAKGKVIIRAHGVEKEIYEKANELNLKIIDLTCPKVLQIHKIAEEYANKKYFILLVGQKEHPETIGTISFCGKYSYIIEKEEDIKEAEIKIKQSNLENLIIISQTTFSLEKFEKLVNTIREKIEINVEVKNTICLATKIRQEETKKIAKEVDSMIIIGGKHSSNTNKLYEISKEYCKNVIFIETKSELNVKEVKQYNKIGVMAGASTSQKSIQELVDILS